MIKPLTEREKAKFKTIRLNNKLHIKPVSSITSCLQISGDEITLICNDDIMKFTSNSLIAELDDLSKSLNFFSKTDQRNAHLIVWTDDIQKLFELFIEHNVLPTDIFNHENYIITFKYNNYFFVSIKNIAEQGLKTLAYELNITEQQALFVLADYMMKTYVNDDVYPTIPTTVTQMTHNLIGRNSYIYAKSFMSKDNYAKRTEKGLITPGRMRSYVHQCIMRDLDPNWFIETLGIDHVPVPLEGINDKYFNFLKFLPKPPFMYLNTPYIDEIIPDVYHYDLSGSYSSSALMELYPDGWWKYCVPGSAMKQLRTHTKPQDLKYCYIVWVQFENLRCKNYPWLPESKDNCYMLTDVQYYTLQSTYEWDSIKCTKAIQNCKHVLPRYLCETIKEIVEKKYAKEKTISSILAKPMTERIYGKGVTKPRYSYQKVEVDYNDAGEVEVSVNTVDKRKGFLESEIVEHLWRNYLINPIWSVYMQDYARYNIINCAVEIGRNNLLYADTDCLAFTNDSAVKVIEDYNAKISKRMKSTFRDYDWSESNITTRFGQFQNEALKKSDEYSKLYKEFIFSCTKRYAGSYLTKNNEIREFVTASGIQKGLIEHTARIENISIITHFNYLLNHPIVKQAFLSTIKNL